MLALSKTNSSNASVTNLQPASVRGCVETLEQGYAFLHHLEDNDYTHVAQPHLCSSIGQHYRHWLDIFHALQHTQEGVVDYNQRRRGHHVETSRQAAMKEIEHLIDWVLHCSPKALHAPVTVISEVSLSASESIASVSTFERELTFAALHASHHFAMAKVVASLLGIKAYETFGLAPATASFYRGQ
ncbi:MULTISPECIES: hypothetical protein [unclassified Vibrio]|uniref:hypothetical protein n=1 Tax=unclassified Vibrio TaxID=2614977 RepID=UPI00136129DE|nr:MULTISPECIES: hypothetical protein [unclassified Vibrio]NAW58144.1 hypothetical protein [Vibrio sp. V36_P2S2PM302]NAX22153.1 hypothetical protein [Vibrio sp. V39_P1S14PM300]NAX25341.1 hypothetical protein [Vibrio sp. V38_P2S17PM301]NAX30595.1 hypothetical protein [Vibrio sp. V37_P2S8PM304]